MLYDLKLKSSYNFSLLAPNIIGASYLNATVVSFFDYATASAFAGDLAATHAAVYPSLPVGTPKNAKDLDYVRIKTSAGDYRVLALNWIASQPVLVVNKVAQILVRDASAEDLSRLRSMMVQNGFTDFSVQFIETGTGTP
jgi:hypothetical protein